MSDLEKSISLAAILQMSPPQVQKVLIEKILELNKITFTPEIIEVYEEYWKNVIKNYDQNFLHK